MIFKEHSIRRVPVSVNMMSSMTCSNKSEALRRMTKWPMLLVTKRSIIMTMKKKIKIKMISKKMTTMLHHHMLKANSRKSSICNTKMKKRR